MTTSAKQQPHPPTTRTATATVPITFEGVIEQLRLLGTSDRLLGLYELGIEACTTGQRTNVTTVLHELIGSLDYGYVDIAQGFRRVYDYCLEQVGEGNLEPVGFVLQDLRDTLLRAVTDTAVETAPRA